MDMAIIRLNISDRVAPVAGFAFLPVPNPERLPFTGLNLQSRLLRKRIRHEMRPILVEDQTDG